MNAGKKKTMVLTKYSLNLLIKTNCLCVFQSRTAVRRNSGFQSAHESRSRGCQSRCPAGRIVKIDRGVRTD